MKSKKLLVGFLIFSFLLMIVPTVAILGHANSQKMDIGKPLEIFSVQTFTGTISQGSDSTQHTFSVTSAITLIEVQLSFSSSYDFDLSLWDNQARRTGGWTSSDHSLKTNIPNSQYSGYSANPEWIDVDPPATTGTWSVGCYSYSGSGSYTITVTITTESADTTPPTVSLTAPVNGATVSGSITVSASASDNVGVSYVDFAVDGTIFATDSTATYQATLDTTTLTEGTHTISATAYDAAGNNDVDTVSVTVENGTPDNELTSGVPVSGSLSSVGQTEMWYIIVDSNAQSMRSVLTCGSADFDLYGRLGAEPTTSTYTWRGYTSGGEDVTYANPGAGTWYIMVRDYSGSGSYTLTVTITYTIPDTTPPTVSITAPTNGATVSGSITVSASASDNVGVSSVIFQVDGSTIATDTSSPYQTSLDTTTLTDGLHTISATAYDAAGNSDIDSVTVTVENGTPDNELTSGVPVTSSLSSVGQTEMWYIVVGSNAASMRSVLTCGSADFDLYGRLGAEPTTSTYTWRGYTSGGEDVTYNNPGAGTWYIMVRDYSGSGSYTLTVTITYNAPDTTPPTISIISPSQGATVSSAKIDWTGSDSGSGIAYYEVRIDSGTWINKGTSTTHTFSVVDGSHTAEVRAWDNAGNSNTDSVTFTVDSTTPSGEKIAVLFWASDAGTQTVINNYKNYLEDEGYTKFFDFKDSTNVQSACQSVDDYETAEDTIFVYIIGHGNNDGSHSYTAFRPSGSIVYSNTFRGYMDLWEAERKCILVESCHSGDWADDFAGSPYLAMSTSDETHNSYALSTLPGEGKFSYYFFYAVRNGYNAVDAFNYAKPYCASPVQNPKIRDYSTYVWFAD